MKGESPIRPGFYVSHEAYYRSVVKHREIMIGDYPEGGGTRGEFAIRWIPLGEHEAAPRLEVFGDGWSTLQAMIKMYNLVGRLAELGEDPGPDRVATLLLVLGFEDLTKRDIPDNAEAAELRQRALVKLTPDERLALGFGRRP